MKLSTRKYLLALLLLPLLLAGCINEDQSDCPAGLKVYFTWEPATYARMGVEASEVDKIDLFVFDQAGILRSVWTDEHPTLSPDYFMTLPNHPEGDYRFIAWCGVHHCYSTVPAHFIVGQTTLTEAMLVLDSPSGEVAGGVLPLFHAHKTEQISATREQRVYLPLVQAYNTIRLTTEGLPQSSDTYRLTIYDNNGTYNFDHSFATCGDFKYTVPCTKDAQGQLAASLHVLKLADGRHPQFEIYNVTQGRILYAKDLMQLLWNVGGSPLDSTHTFDIHIRFTTDMKAVIYVNGWQVTEDDVWLI